MITIRRITAADPLYAQEVRLREEVLLRPIGLDIESFGEMFPGAEAKFEHFVAVFDHPDGLRVVGCALLLPHYPKDGSGKLMQMAVDVQLRGQQIGRRLVAEIERRAFGELGLEELFCHAQHSAYGFYSALGWRFTSEQFEEAGVLHRAMAVRADAPAPPLERFSDEL